MNKYITILFFVVFNFQLAAQSIKKVEYFFDTDPGVGNGIAIPVSTSDTVRLSAATISSSALSTGLHSLYIRSKNDNGWGLTESFPLYIVPVINASKLISAEYFIDTDQGAGNGIPIIIGSPTDTARFAFNISSSGLSEGIHTINVRFKDAIHNYSHFQSFPFYITRQVAMPAIISAEYFFETDPGIGNGTPLNISPSADTIIRSFAIPVSCLNTENIYHLYIRVKDGAGNWRHFETDNFKLHGPNSVVTINSGSWNDPSIWSTGIVPNGNSQIILNHDVVVHSNATCRSLLTNCHDVHVDPGVLLVITGNN